LPTAFQPEPGLRGALTACSACCSYFGGATQFVLTGHCPMRGLPCCIIRESVLWSPLAANGINPSEQMVA
jgi:hypothetical protein